MESAFQPDYTNILKVLINERPGRLPVYEHHIDPLFISKVLKRQIVPGGSKEKDYIYYYSQICSFWKDMTYDAFDYEAAICDCFPGHGAIMGGSGPIQNRRDFEEYPFDDIPRIFRERYKPHFNAIRKALPPGMKAYGGCGYGIFESTEDLVGFESLATLQYTDPDLFADLFTRVGDLYVILWSEVIRHYNDIFVFYRMGDDLGYKTQTLLAPEAIREHIIPQYRRVIDLVHAARKKFLLHSCGCIFDVMDDLINAGIDAKHSNEDEIAPFSRWIDLYSHRIGLFGGIDVNVLCLSGYDEVFRKVLRDGTEFRAKAKGYGLGSGNSIPDYIPVEGYMAMIDAVKEIRSREEKSAIFTY